MKYEISQHTQYDLQNEKLLFIEQTTLLTIFQHYFNTISTEYAVITNSYFCIIDIHRHFSDYKALVLH